jgi:hypothetical protein
MELTQARAGMLVCGEPFVARQLLVREHADEATLGELALFAVSPEHHRLRAKLGVAIGVAADAPDGPPPAPAPPPLPTPAPQAARSARLSAETIVRALLDPAIPPSTVGELFDALGIELGASVVAASAGATLILAPHVVDGVSEQQLAVRYAVDPRPESAPPTEAWLRERRIVAFSLVCADGAAIEAALRARFAPGPVLIGDEGDDYHAFGRWVHTLRSGLLAWFERSPEWLSAPADADARSAALRALLASAAPAKAPTDQPSRFSVAEHFAKATASREEALAEAERAALASGKQLFDYGYLKGSRVGDESTARFIYYLVKPELRTLDEFIEYLDESAVWDQR